MPIGKKYCTKCHQWKSIDDFHRDKQSSDGRNGNCIACRRIRAARPHRRLYVCWSHMIARCYNKQDKSYRNYGGRGIKVCSAWRNDWPVFRAWALSNGFRKGLEIDRRDNNCGYSPANCHFVTKLTNLRNTRITRLDVDDVAFIRYMLLKGKHVVDIAKLFHVKIPTIYTIKHYRSWKEVQPLKLNTISRRIP